MKEITLQEMMEVGLHFGHQTKRWNPKMRKYIFGSRNGIYIIDLQKTQRLFKKALDFVKKVSASGGNVLFVGSKVQGKPIIIEQANACGMPYVAERWLGGMLTNFETVKKSVSRLNQLQEMRDDGSFKILAKKESMRLQKEMMKLERNLGGIQYMNSLPSAVFIIDTRKERIALSEANKLGLPVIGLVDTNCDPDGIDYIIPGNDDANRAIQYVTGALTEAIMEGKKEHEMKAKALAEERARMAEKVIQEEKPSAPAVVSKPIEEASVTAKEAQPEAESQGS